MIRVCGCIHSLQHKSLYSVYVIKGYMHNMDDNHAWTVEFCELSIRTTHLLISTCQHAEGQNSSPSYGEQGKQGVCEAFGPWVQSRPRRSGYRECHWIRVMNLTGSSNLELPNFSREIGSNILLDCVILSLLPKYAAVLLMKQVLWYQREWVADVVTKDALVFCVVMS